jgi:sugar/nucleoside kinase (ribokinase family)
LQRKVLCFGDCSIDILVPIDKMPVSGGCSFSSEKVISIGGSAANVAAGLAYLGANVSLLSMLGEDLLGEAANKLLEKLGVNRESVLQSRSFPTGLVIGLVFPDGEKKWISVRRCSADIHIDWAMIEDVQLPDIVFVSGIMINEGIESRIAAQNLAKKAKKQERIVILDPNIRIPDWELSVEKRHAYMKTLESVDIFLPNKQELFMITDCSDLREASSVVLDKGVSEIWVKDGADGCTFISRAIEEHFAVPKVNVVDSSGAGDAFNAALILARLIRKQSITESGRLATDFGSKFTEYLGTTNVFENLNLDLGGASVEQSDS